MCISLNTPITDWSNQHLWIIGASSGIGAAIAKQALSVGAHVTLSARRTTQLHEIANTSSRAQVVAFDVLDNDAWQPAYDEARRLKGKVDLVIFCAADYLPQRTWEVKALATQRTIHLNLSSVYSGLETVLPDMLAQGNGGIALIASVAGYMGLPNASTYGPTKAALINLAEILYGDLHPKGLNIYLINPGFVHTKLTEKNSFKMPAIQTPEQAAKAIWRGLSRGHFEIHFPHRFTYVLKIIRLLPYRWRFGLFNQFFKV
ncbi:SDR family NAD(P)-dependent oxidoreductase [Aquirhabdus parva]|uniref:SDR family NAD(P)-dependent oxidoreductase n=1 Tax=Aquirhabdus parva TaxID=2283318 RepID=A0A345P4V5_9GAMM|nr:SDR family NAD(P)-dependent oxidoreductase [Aquirhabdus parva]AXI02314.1 SDR family NAD(P)-dependent oxidoreductase [Aquirhabdus parva]